MFKRWRGGGQGRGWGHSLPSDAHDSLVPDARRPIVLSRFSQLEQVAGETSSPLTWALMHLNPVRL